MKFAILEHRQVASVHYDLLLEQPGAQSLRTWAMACRPFSPGWQPAIELPRHRLVYLRYEGPISRMRGWVRRIDQGAYHVCSDTKTYVCVLLRGLCLRGRLEIRRENDSPTEWRLTFDRSLQETP